MFINLNKLDRRDKEIVKGPQRGVYYTNNLNVEMYISTWSRYHFTNPYRRGVESLLSVNPDHSYGDDYRSGYGLADNVEQVLEHYKHLKDSQEQFVIFMTPMYRKDQSEWGGFRFHKWGEYIGTHDLNYEYLYDQTDIDVIYVYHVYHVAGCLSRPPRIGNRIVKLNVKKKRDAFMKINFSKRTPPSEVSHTTYLKKKGR